MRAILLVLLFSTIARLEGAIARDFRTIESSSGQVIVRWLEKFRVPPFLRQDEENAGIIVLSPELVSVSAERIKEGLLQQLGTTDRWRGKIRFHFASGKSNPTQFEVQSTRYTNGWTYQITISPKIHRQVWLRGCVAVFLLEMSNRMAQERSSEVPVWLIEGLAMELSETALVDLSPSFTNQIQVGGTNPGLGRVIAPQQHRDPLIATRQFLRQNVPVSVTELFFPEPEHLTGNKSRVYQQSAHFLFRQVIGLRAGKESLQQFLVSLPSYLNWQQAFYATFQRHFASMLDLEKWWSVALTDLTQLTPISSWTVNDSVAYLNRIITPAALVGQRRTELPTRQNFTLQQVIDEWPFDDQQPTLEQITNRLRVLSIYAAPDLRPVIQGYQTTIQSYLEQRKNVGFEPARRGQTRLRATQVVRQARRDLDRLDSQRQTVLSRQ